MRNCGILVGVRLSRNYSFEVGNGLFTSRTIPKDTHIVDFVGEYLNNVAEIQRRRMHSDTGGYLLGNTTGTFAIDCFEACRRGQCLASFANCPLNCYNVVQKQVPVANARLVVLVMTKLIIFGH